MAPEDIAADIFTRTYGVTIQAEHVDTQLPIIRDNFHYLVSQIQIAIGTATKAAVAPLTAENARLKDIITNLYREAFPNE